MNEPNYTGHLPGHMRENFADWVVAGAPDVAAVEIYYSEHLIDADDLLRSMRACTDTLPGWLYEEVLEVLEGDDRYLRRNTYGAAARALRRYREVKREVAPPNSTFDELLRGVASKPVPVARRVAPQMRPQPSKKVVTPRVPR
jgi:hypothetical protein